MTGIVDNDHCRELVAQFTGFLPPDDEVSKKNKCGVIAPDTHGRSHGLRP